MPSIRLAVRLVTIVGIALLVMGCGRPSEDNAREALATWLDATAGNGIGKFRVVQFVKTNAVSSETNGVATYTVEFDAVLECMTDGRVHETAFFQPMPGQTNWQNKGDQYRAKGIVVFSKTEKGWRDNLVRAIY